VPALQRRSHFDDTGLIMEGPAAVHAAQQQQQGEAADEREAADEGQTGAAVGGPLDPEALLQQRLQEAIASGAAPPGTTVEAVIDSMAAFMAEANGEAALLLGWHDLTCRSTHHHTVSEITYCTRLQGTSALQQHDRSTRCTSSAAWVWMQCCWGMHAERLP
jgi:hypothetical protein